jgi:DNA-directed RNA polymerase specialized sigma24 family protein
MVHGVLLARVPVGEVDDLVQDVFLLALRRLSTLRETGSFGAWLAVIARNLANDYHRRTVPEDQLAPRGQLHAMRVSAMVYFSLFEINEEISVKQTVRLLL